MNERFNTPDIEKKDFIFISYKHDDIAVVDAVISRLYEKGVRIWYDANLHIGDRWTQIAQEKIFHPNCRGVIFFNSVSSFKSKPVHFERSWTLERINSSDETSFGCFSANVNNESYLYILKRVFDSLPDDPKLIEKEFPLEQVEAITRLFDDKIIYANPCDPDSCAQSLFNAIQDKFKSVIDPDYVNMQKLQKRGVGTDVSLSFGVYKHSQAVVAIPPYRLSINGIVDDPGDERVKYMVIDKNIYATRPIRWTLLYLENDICIFLSKDLVDIRHGGESLTEWINNDFCNLSFTDEHRAIIRQVRLLSQEDIEKTSDKSTFIFENDATHWWLSERKGSLQSVVLTDGTIHNRFNCERIKSGVRPVIAIHKDDLAALIRN